jgi:hypothetical protein
MRSSFFPFSAIAVVVVVDETDVDDGIASYLVNGSSFFSVGFFFFFLRFLKIKK